MEKQVVARLVPGGLRSVLIISMLANMMACTNSGRKGSPSIPKFVSVAMVNKGASDELKARFGVAPEESNSQAGILAGAGAGAALAAKVSLVCVGFVYICALGVVPFGAAVGAVSGGLADHAVDTGKELSKEHLLVLDGLFAQIAQERTIHQEIENSLKRRIPASRLVEPRGADALLQYRLYDVRFSKTYPRIYALTLKTVMLFEWNRNGSQTSSTYRKYEHTSPSRPMEDWVQDRGLTLNMAFNDCVKELTDKMIKDIQFEEP